MRKLFFVLFLMVSFATFGIQPRDASALAGSDFQAGRIIDDGIFFNPNTIGINTIQDFLNSKVPACDTYGTQPSSHAGYPTRAAWGSANGNPPPYTCLKGFRQDTPSKAAEPGLCNQYVGGAKSAAQIVYDVGQMTTTQLVIC